MSTRLESLAYCINMHVIKHLEGFFLIASSFSPRRILRKAVSLAFFFRVIDPLLIAGWNASRETF